MIDITTYTYIICIDIVSILTDLIAQIKARGQSRS